MFHINSAEEKTVLVVRRHWFILLRDTLLLVILYILPFAVISWLQNGAAGIPNIPSFSFNFSPAASTFIAVLWTLFMWTRLFDNWTNYYLDFWIITDKRIVAIDQIRFFDREMSIFRMERIQDVVVNVNGFLSTLLNFGNLHIETASLDENFTIRNVPNPQRVKDAILAEHDRAVEGGSKNMAEQGL